jgi:membrane protease YdiL (CAAX protease family)
MAKIPSKNVLHYMKIIFLEKGSILWKLPLILYLVRNFSVYSQELFINIMLSFTIAKKEPQILESLPHAQAYPEILRNAFFSYGIDSIIYEIFFFLIVILFATVFDRLKSEDMGINISLKSIFLVLSGAIISFIVVSAITLALYMNGNLEFIGLNTKIPSFSKKLLPIIIFQGVLFIFVAFQEEIFCRAYILNNLKYFGKKFAIICAALLFAVLHISNIDYFSISKIIGLTNIFILSIIFCIYFYRFKDLWLLIGAHFSWNFFMGPFYGMTISNIEKLKGNSILKVQLSGKEYITGDKFGPEGSIFTSIVLISILAIFLGITYFKGKKINKSKDIFV